MSSPLRLVFRCFAVMLLSLFCLPQLYASHGVAVDLTYECIDPAVGQYQFTLVYYRDCDGITPSATSLSVTGGNGCGVTTNITLSQVSVTDQSQLCDPSTSSCNGGSQPGVEQYIYQGVATIGTGCSNLVVSFSECCRTSAITNLSSTGTTYVETVINSNHPQWGAPCNSSPQFGRIPVLYTCAGQPAFYSHDAQDPDGDSLVFSISEPLDGASSSIAYSAGFNAAEPFCTNNTFTLDPSTGQIAFTPCANQSQYAVVGFTIEEYRNGLLINTSRREVVIVVLNNCTNTSSQVDSFTVNQGVLDTTGLVTTISVCGGNQLDLCLNISDPDIIDSLSISSNVGNIIPGATYTVTYPTANFNEAIVCFTIPTDSVATGSYTFVTFIEDNACPISAQQAISYRLDLENLQLELSKEFICPNSIDTIQLEAVGFGGAAAPGTYSWSPAALFDNPNVHNPTAYILDTVDLICTYTDGSCIQQDTVDVSAPFPAVINPIPDVTICNGNSAQVFASVQPGPGPQTFTLSGTATIQPDSIVDIPITTSGIAPVDILSTSIQSVCLDMSCGNGFVRDLNLFLISPTGCILPLMNGQGGINDRGLTGACFTPDATQAITAYNTPFSDIPNNADFIPVGANGFGGLNGCAANGQWILRIQHNLAPSLGGVPCTVTDWSITFNDQSAASFYWSPNYNISCTNCDSSIISPTVDTQYQVIAQNTFGCSDTTSFNAVIDTAYPAPIIVCDSVTATDVYFSWQPIFGSGGYSISVNGGPAFTQAVTNTTYSVGGLTPGQCVDLTIYALSGGSCADGPSTTHSCCASGCINPITSSTPTSCNGTADGSATVALTFATPPITYQWDAAAANQTTSTATNLAAGSYSVTIVEGTGCVATATVVVSEPTVLQVTNAVSSNYNGQDVSCANASDGEATATVNGGTAPYTYVWSNGQISSTATNLSAGIACCLTVTDNNGCTATDCITLTAPAPISATTTTTDVNCFGGADGTASVVATGGTATVDYSYSWSTAPIQNTATATGLTAGTYTVTITDDNGCSITETATVVEPTATVTATAAVISNYNGQDISCAGSCDGEAEVFPLGGTPAAAGYQYLWPNGQTTAIATNLCVGTYAVTVTDSLGCSAVATVSLNEPLPLLSTMQASTDVSCNVGNDGAATVNVTDGTAPYTYNWSDASAQTTATATNLAAGQYFVTVEDANGCQTLDSVVINEPTAVTVSLAISSNYNGQDVSCNGSSDGEAIATATGGSGGYTYLWDANTANQTGASATALAANISYCVTVTDVNGCTATNCITLAEPTALSATSSTTDALCFAGADGTATVVASGGTVAVDYAYSWSTSPVQTTATATGLSAGTYTVTISDDNGCNIIETVTVGEPATAVSATTTTTDALCLGSADGTVTVLPTGGAGSYTYLWDAAAGSQTTATATGLVAGNYCVTVTDVQGCTFSICETVADGIAIQLSATTSPTLCFGSADGSATVTATGGAAGYSYLWSAMGQTTATATGLIAGPHTVTVTDANGCAVDTTVTVNQPTALATPIFNSSTISCNGLTDGTATVSTSGGIAPYTYLWENGQTTATATALAAGMASVTITDANGCFIIDSVNIVEPTAVVATLVTDSISCYGLNDGQITATTTGGQPPYTYNWSNGQTGFQISNLLTGPYDVTVTDANGCSVTLSTFVGQPASAVVVNIINPVNPICAGDSDGEMTADALGGTPNYTFIWSDGQTTATADGLAPGTYAVTATDARGCTSSTSATITAPSAIVLNVQQYSNYNGAAISCPAAADGAAQVTASGGVSPYTYAWSGAQPQNGTIASNLAAGTYAVTVTDASGCTAIDSISLADPVPLDATIQQVNVFCANDCDGQIIATAVSGTGTLGVNGYEYRILGPGQTGNVFSSNNNFTGLCVGTYTVEVRDGNNCVLPISVTITEPRAIQLSLSDTDVSCAGGSDGTASVSASGGTPPYSYNWDNGMTGATITGLMAGTYEVTVTDANGCDRVSTTEVEEPLVLMASMSATSPSCNGSTDGNATVSVQGGTMPYTYFWSDGQGTATAVGLSAGTHSVTVTDANACQLVESIVIGEPSLLTTTITTNTAACAGANSGSATAVPAGGTAPYTYLWSDGQTTATAVNLAPGAYSVVVVDSQGCSVTEQVLLQDPDPVVLSFVSSSNPSCNGDQNGSATVVVSGGNAPYTYLWSNGETTATATSLGAGVNTVTATDANGCSTTLDVNLVEPAVLVVDTIQMTAVNCKGGADGTATLFLSGGTLPYSFAWSNGMTGQSISGLAAGTYVVSVTDANGCMTNSQIIITEPASELVATLNTADALCFGGSSGQITAIVSGGTANSNGEYTYAWSNGASSDVNSNLSVGTYSVTITDANGCSLVRSATVNESSGISSQIVNVTDASCTGSTDGSAQVTASGGTGTLSYQWSDPLGQTTNVATGLSAGTYYVSVTDLNGCTQVDTAVVGEALALSITVAIDDVDCYGASTGSISITNSNEPLQASYWSNGVVGTSITSVAAGQYGVVVQSINGCVDSFSYLVGQPAELELSLNQVRAVDCYNNSTGALGSTVAGGTSPYSYLWSNGAATPSIDSIAAGNYTLNVEDANGCKVDTSISLANPTEVGIGNLNIRGVACVGDANGSIQLDGTGGSTLLGGYTYSLDSLTFQGGNLFVGLEAGIYPLYVQDNNGCLFDTLVTVEAADPFFITSFGPALDSGEVEYVLEYGDTLTLFADLNDTTAASWTWTEVNSGVLLDSSLEISLTPYESGIYQFTAMNASGCLQDSSIVVKMEKPRNAAAPTAFTPNNDGNNDRFFIQGDEKVSQVLVFRVYDRWGELVYEGLELDPNDPLQGWDGSFKGKPMNSGAYAWYAEVLYIDGETAVINGAVNLLR